ncbi:MAG TPA: hypothetical protein VK638_08875 [Edaphobacter sp.]|nr:hypothetical protein [Edaphobacter sp.]
MRHKLPRVVNQVSQYVKGLGSQWDTISIAPQEVVRRIQTKRLE